MQTGGSAPLSARRRPGANMLSITSDYSQSMGDPSPFLKRIADPQEIVGPVCYLVSEASSFVTGDDLSVSGGMLK